MTMRIGLAGLGAHGLRYAKHLLDGDVKGARLTVVSRSNETAGRTFAQEHGLEFVADARELATHSEVDAVMLVLPPDLHPDIACECLEHRRPVLVEKPIAPDAAAARRIALTSDRCDTPLMVGQTLRFDSVVEAIKREARELGPLRSVVLHQRFEPSDRSWIDTPGRGGLLLNTGVHSFDLLRFLTGLEATRLSAEVSRTQTLRTEDVFTALVRLEPGPVLCIVDNTRATRSRSGRIEIVGERGQVWGDHVHRTLHRVRDRQCEDLGPVAQRHTVPATMNAFVSCLLEDRPMPVTGWDGVAAAQMIDAATESARSGERVSIADPRAGG